MISIPRLGCINFHTSDLPRYRGFASTSWAILRGERQVAITAHRMVSAKADEGEILLKRHIPIDETTDIGELFIRIEAEIPGMVKELLDLLEADRITPEPQDETKRLLSFPRHPSDGWIEWGKPAAEIDRLVRSVARPYPGAFTCWQLRKVIIWKGHVHPAPPPFVGIPGHIIGSDDDRSVKVLTGEGIYIIDEVQLDDEQATTSPAQVFKGMQQRLGLSAGELFELIRIKTDIKENEL
jgi:methionyl-tRNA formyltransferase